LEAKQFIERIESETKVPVNLIGTGADAQDLIDRRGSDGKVA
jgi:adenylosuccinate synthase